MQKIGFIDYYIDEWHANNYPRMIRESSFKDRFDVALAWDEGPQPDRKPLSDWCREQSVRQAATLEQVVAECDCIVVLSPDNTERHEALADLPLRSGKPVYVDKPFAPTLAAARRLFKIAAEHKTPLMSCSALRFGSALDKALRQDLAGRKAHFVATRGGGAFPIYAIHQLEMLVMTMGTGARRLKQCGGRHADLMVIDYGDGRRGVINLLSHHPFQLSARYGDDKFLVINEMDDFFTRFIDGMLTFFETGQPLAPEAETLEIVALIEAGNRALAIPDRWSKVPTV